MGCTRFCSIQTHSAAPIGFNHATKVVTMTSDFEVRLSVRGMSATSGPDELASLFELRDVFSDDVLLAAYMSNSLFLTVEYNGVVISTADLELHGDFANTWTRFSVSVAGDSLFISSDVSPVLEFPLDDRVSTIDRQYSVMVSSKYGQSSGGDYRDVEIYGEGRFYCAVHRSPLVILAFLCVCVTCRV
jgi:hypothetical protein